VRRGRRSGRSVQVGEKPLAGSCVVRKELALPDPFHRAHAGALQPVPWPSEARDCAWCEGVRKWSE